MNFQSNQTALRHNCPQQFLQHGVELTGKIAVPEAVAPDLKRWSNE